MKLYKTIISNKERHKHKKIYHHYQQQQVIPHKLDHKLSSVKAHNSHIDKYFVEVVVDIRIFDNRNNNSQLLKTHYYYSTQSRSNTFNNITLCF